MNKITKHLRVKESNEIGGATRYHGICGASGLSHLEYAKDINSVNCLKCHTALKLRRKAAK